MSSKDRIKTNTLQLRKAMRCESLDEGTFAFLIWINYKSFDTEACEQNPPLILRYAEFPKVGLVRLFGRFLGHYIFVNIVDYVPLCKTCTRDDCSHVGFTICLLLLSEREGFESMDDVLK